ncbi:hypothetical protein SCA6_007311 [Theobroma cacao]
MLWSGSEEVSFCNKALVEMNGENLELEADGELSSASVKVVSLAISIWVSYAAVRYAMGGENQLGVKSPNSEI